MGQSRKFPSQWGLDGAPAVADDLGNLIRNFMRIHIRFTLFWKLTDKFYKIENKRLKDTITGVSNSHVACPDFKFGTQRSQVSEAREKIKARKPCCRKETARLRSCSFRFKDHRQHTLQL